MALSKEVKVGLLALVAGIILYVGFNYLKGIDFFSPTKKYYVVYNDVGGLTVSNPVSLNGVPVGRVDETRIMVDRNNKVLVTVEINDDIKVGNGTLAELKSSSFLGGMEINLILRPNKGEPYKNGDTLTGFQKQDIMAQISEKALPVIDQLDTLMIRMNKMFDPAFSQNVQKTMTNLQVATGDLSTTLKENRSKINNITTNFSELSASLVDMQKKFGPIVDNFKQVSDTLKDLRLKRVVDNANLAMKDLNEITKKLNSKEGTMGMLIHDPTLYNTLNKSVSNLDSLVNYFQYNPKHFLKPLGRKPPKGSTPNWN
ncbi:MAG: MlaD family protein [Cytophagaceae bacterium]|nr:MlaD family protein [Cytophagaceae bacterium]